MQFVEEWRNITQARNRIAGGFAPPKERKPAAGLKDINTRVTDRKLLFDQIGADKERFESEFLWAGTSGTSSQYNVTNEDRVTESYPEDIDFANIKPVEIEKHLFEYARTAIAASYVVDAGNLPDSMGREANTLESKITSAVPGEILKEVDLVDIKAILVYDASRELEDISVQDFIDYDVDRGNILDIVQRYDSKRLDTVEEYILDSGVTSPIRRVLRVRLNQRRDLIEEAVVEYTKQRGVNPLIEAVNKYLQNVEERQEEISNQVETIQTNRNEIRRLNQNIRKFESNLQNLTEQVANNEADIEELDGKIETKIYRIREQHNSLANNIKDNIEELEAFQTDLQEIRTEVEDIAETTARTEVNAIMHPKLLELENQLEDLRGQINSEESNKNRLEAQLEDLNERIGDVEDTWDSLKSSGLPDIEPIEEYRFDASTARLWEEDWLERVRDSIYSARSVYVQGEGTVNIQDKKYVWSSTQLMPGISDKIRRELKASSDHSIASFPLRQRVHHKLSTAPILRTAETLLEIVPVVYANPEMYLREGVDRLPAGVSAITDILDTVDEPDAGVTQVVAIGSLTGWSDHAVTQIEGGEGVPRSRASEKRVICLVDLIDGESYGSTGDLAYIENQILFNHSTDEDRIVHCQDKIMEYLAAAKQDSQIEGTHGLLFSDAIEQFDYAPEVIYGAFKRIEQRTSEYELFRLEQGLCLVPA